MWETVSTEYRICVAKRIVVLQLSSQYTCRGAQDFLQLVMGGGAARMLGRMVNARSIPQVRLTQSLGISGGPSCEAGIAVDCILGDWGIWSTCDMHNMRFRDKRSLDAVHMQYMRFTEINF